MNSAARPFRAALRGWSVLSRQRTRDVFANASVILNLQDVQMLGAWNPQTFDLLALGVAQVVWNEAPVDYLDWAPPFGVSADALADLVAAQIDDPDIRRISGGLEEVEARHRWRHRAMTLVEM
ncbi:MAG: hypothetical protein E7812_16925 [Phenylobacterium sp.]|nr:MAG: hypothetical protein E7812_16925 [Phenylobacterium sp.]